MVKKLSHHSYSCIYAEVNSTNVCRGFLSLKWLLVFLLYKFTVLCLYFIWYEGCLSIHIHMCTHIHTGNLCFLIFIWSACCLVLWADICKLLSNTLCLGPFGVGRLVFPCWPLRLPWPHCVYIVSRFLQWPWQQQPLQWLTWISDIKIDEERECEAERNTVTAKSKKMGNEGKLQRNNFHSLPFQIDLFL